MATPSAQFSLTLRLELPHRPPGLLTIIISLLLCVGEELLTPLLSVLPRFIDLGLGFSAHPGQFGVELFLGFLILGF